MWIFCKAWRFYWKVAWVILKCCGYCESLGTWWIWRRNKSTSTFRWNMYFFWTETIFGKKYTRMLPCDQFSSISKNLGKMKWDTDKILHPCSIFNYLKKSCEIEVGLGQDLAFRVIILCSIFIDRKISWKWNGGKCVTVFSQHKFAPLEFRPRMDTYMY